MKIELPFRVNQIIQRLNSAGYEAYAVGGCVRDSMLKRSPKDWDITTKATPGQVKELFERTVDTGIQHGTVTVMFGKEGFEVTTYRVDGEYEDHRHPKQVEFTSNLIEDLKRRDFTINAMAYNNEEGLIDVFGGLDDLKKRRVRCVGTAAERFDEDALRILRAVRFAAQLDFTIEQNTLEAIRDKAIHLKGISAERIREELNKLLMSDHPEKLLIAKETGITKVVLPEFDQLFIKKIGNHTAGEHCIAALKYCISHETAKKQGLILRWALLLQHAEEQEDIEYRAKKAKAVLKRLKSDNETSDGVEILVKYADYSFGLTPWDMRKAMNLIGTTWVKELFFVQRANIIAQEDDNQDNRLKKVEQAEQLYEGICARKECVCLKELAVNGRDLIQAGYESGKLIGQKLQELLEIVLKDPTKNNKEELLKNI